MHRDVVAEDLGENPPGLQPPFQCRKWRPHSPLHCLIHRQIRIIPRTFDFVRVAAVALIGLDLLAWLVEITQNLVKI